MRKEIRFFLTVASIIILVLFIIFIINQTAQITDLAARVHPILGQVVFWCLIGIYALLVTGTLYYYFRLPEALENPPEERTPEYSLYLNKLGKRLGKNSYLKGQPLKNRHEIEAAISILEAEATADMKKTANTVFISTAISQSGRLDALVVLLAQIRMIWRIALVYNQRPSLREMLQLYANVAATTFIASEIDDIDIGQQVEPVITSVLGGSLTSGIPGVGMVGHIITNSLLSGSANAYLTLRVAAITKRYCSPVVRKERKKIRRSATVEAAKMLSSIALNSAGNISRAIVEAAVKYPGRLSQNLVRSAFKKFSKESKPARE